MKILLTKYNEKILLLAYDQNNLVDLRAFPVENNILGKIYAGRVSRVLKNLNACFVDVAPDMDCFLSFSECLDGYIPKQEDIIPVQIIREALKTKEPAVSMKLQLQGTYLVVTSDVTNGVGVSKKIALKKERARFKKLFTKADGSLLDEQIGVVVRTSAFKVPDETLLKEYELLSARLKEIISNSKSRSRHCILYESFPEYIKLIIGYGSNEIDEIVTDDTEIYEELKAQLNANFDTAKIRLYDDERVSLSNVYSIDARLSEVLNKNVWLKSGGYLVIEQTEALNVIDVNTGKFDKKKSHSDTIKLINKEAAIEAARQIRLRNLSGIIIIDFINDDKDGEKEFISVLQEALKADKGRPVFVDITKLGLVEITRKKVTPSLKEQLR